MKKFLLFALAAIMTAGSMQAKTADEVRVYLNPGHGSWGPNDRPMATIPYPALSETGRPDTNGFYESNTNLWKSKKTYETLIKMGVKEENITMSRWYNGPYPYVSGASDQYVYNRPLSEICEEVEVGNYDMFVSHHSNANVDGTSTNYPLIIYRGSDGAGGDSVSGSRDMGLTAWPIFYTNEIDPQSYYSPTNPNVRGDISFYGSSSTRTDPNTGKKYTGYLGVLKHGAAGFLIEGYFHTYQPARHRALNPDYCGQEGIRVARGICEYFGLNAEKTGYIMGSVKDVHNHLTHSLYTYSAGTMDQWAPIDGAVVTLLKNGKTVATYTTDTLKNGVFVFEGLEPGTYTITVSAAGYKALGDYIATTVDSQRQEYITAAAGDITVEANKTTYVVPLLEAEDYVEPENLYENYPEPELPAYREAPTELYLTHDDGTTYTIDGTIKRMIVRGDSTVVLSNAEDGTPHIYLIDNVAKTLIKELSINGIAEAEPNNAGFYSRLNDICFTADGQLVGCNSMQTQYGESQVYDGYTRGTLRLYKWADFDSDPVEWVTTQSSANFYCYKAGQSLAIDGAADECTVTLVGTNDYPGNSAGGMRYLKLDIIDNTIASQVYTEGTINANSNYTRLKIGENPQLVLSPRSDDNVVIDGSLTLPFECTPSSTNGVNSPVVGRLADESVGVAAMGVAFFKYAKHQFMVTPYMSDEAVGGIKLYDVTDGLDAASLIKTTNTDLAPLACNFMAAGAAVSGEDIILYLMQDSKITKWTAAADEQPAVAGIYAYGLTATADENGSYIISFNCNSDAEYAYITFYDSEGNEVGTYVVPNVTEGENEVVIAYEDIPGNDGEELNWAVTVEGKAITTIQRINPLVETYTGPLFCAVDKSPASAHMGTIYAGNRYSSNSANNGIYVCDVMGQRVSDELYRGGHSWGSNYRMGIDALGYVYVPDWGDAVSGVYIADPDNMSADFTEFFVGTRASNGMITNNGVNVGSSTPSVWVEGNGADTKMYVYLEDFGNGVGVYNIGHEDGTLEQTWDKAPSNYIDVGSLQANTNGNVIADGKNRGVWVAQYRSAGNNVSGVPSLIFSDNEGNVLFNSGKSPYNEMLNGSAISGFAISDDCDLLVINDGSGVLQFFDITWSDNTPSLTPKFSFTADARTSGGAIYQMWFDYGENLVCSGSNIGIYSMPADRNVHTTPAMSDFSIKKSTAVSEVSTSKTVVSERYFDIRGIEYSQPVEGVNIIVRTYSDGTTQSLKMLKR